MPSLIAAHWDAEASWSFEWTKWDGGMLTLHRGCNEQKISACVEPVYISHVSFHHSLHDLCE